MSKIRGLLPAEYALLNQFLYEAVFVAPGEPRPPRSVVEAPELRAYVEGFGRAGDVAVCAEKDGQVVGVAWARLVHGYGFVNKDVPELAIAVLPAWRGRGMGTRLLTELAGRAAAAGHPALSLSVQRANPALRLYERLGFREVGGDDAEAVMLLSLAPAQGRSGDARGGANGDARGGANDGAGAACDGVPFERARAVALRVLTAPALAGRVFLEGGLVPWVVSGHDSGRPHGDVDVAVRLDDMPAVRAWLREEGLYDAALDSMLLSCNAEGEDFGAHAVVEGVPVSFCPYRFAGGELRQRNAALVGTDGFEALLEAVVPGLREEDYVEVRRLPDGTEIGCATLEAVRAAKAASVREKDARDVAEIDRLGCDAARLGRVLAAFASMRVDCVAHGV